MGPKRQMWVPGQPNPPRRPGDGMTVARAARGEHLRPPQPVPVDVDAVKREAAEMLRSGAAPATLVAAAQLWSVELARLDAEASVVSDPALAAKMADGAAVLAAVLHAPGPNGARAGHERRLRVKEDRRELRRAVVEVLAEAAARDPLLAAAPDSGALPLLWRCWYSVLRPLRDASRAASARLGALGPSDDGAADAADLLRRCTRALRVVCVECRRTLCAVVARIASEHAVVAPVRGAAAGAAGGPVSDAASLACAWLLVCVTDVDRYEAEAASGAASLAQRSLAADAAPKRRSGFRHAPLAGTRAGAAALAHGLWCAGASLRLRPSARALRQTSALWRSAGSPLPAVWAAASAASLARRAPAPDGHGGPASAGHGPGRRSQEVEACRRELDASLDMAVRHWRGRDSGFDAADEPPPSAWPAWPPGSAGSDVGAAVRCCTEFTAAVEGRGASTGHGGGGGRAGHGGAAGNGAGREARQGGVGAGAPWPGGEDACRLLRDRLPWLPRGGVVGLGAGAGAMEVLAQGAMHEGGRVEGSAAAGALALLDGLRHPAAVSCSRFFAAAHRSRSASGVAALSQVVALHASSWLEALWRSVAEEPGCGPGDPEAAGAAAAALETALPGHATHGDGTGGGDEAWDGGAAPAAGRGEGPDVMPVSGCDASSPGPGESDGDLRRAAACSVLRLVLAVSCLAAETARRRAVALGPGPLDPRRQTAAVAHAGHAAAVLASSSSLVLSLLASLLRFAAASRIFALRHAAGTTHARRALAAARLSDGLMAAAAPALAWLASRGAWAVLLPLRPPADSPPSELLAAMAAAGRRLARVAEAATASNAREARSLHKKWDATTGSAGIAAQEMRTASLGLAEARQEALAAIRDAAGTFREAEPEAEPRGPGPASAWAEILDVAAAPELRGPAEAAAETAAAGAEGPEQRGAEWWSRVLRSAVARLAPLDGPLPPRIAREAATAAGALLAGDEAATGLVVGETDGGEVTLRRGGRGPAPVPDAGGGEAQAAAAPAAPVPAAPTGAAAEEDGPRSGVTMAAGPSTAGGFSRRRTAPAASSARNRAVVNASDVFRRRGAGGLAAALSALGSEGVTAVVCVERRGEEEWAVPVAMEAALWRVPRGAAERACVLRAAADGAALVAASRPRHLLAALAPSARPGVLAWLASASRTVAHDGSLGGRRQARPVASGVDVLAAYPFGAAEAAELAGSATGRYVRPEQAARGWGLPVAGTVDATTLLPGEELGGGAEAGSGEEDEAPEQHEAEEDEAAKDAVGDEDGEDGDEEVPAGGGWGSEGGGGGAAAWAEAGSGSWAAEGGTAWGLAMLGLPDDVLAAGTEDDTAGEEAGEGDGGRMRELLAAASSMDVATEGAPAARAGEAATGGAGGIGPLSADWLARISAEDEATQHELSAAAALPVGLGLGDWAALGAPYAHEAAGQAPTGGGFGDDV